MKRYAAFLRGVMPFNCKMADLKRAFERAGFTDVKTVLASGNVVFSAAPAGNAALERRAEQAMAKHLGRVFFTVVRPVDELEALLASDPYASAKLKPGAKKVVTFLRAKPKAKVKLPPEKDGARIVRHQGAEAFSAYVRTPTTKGPEFMKLIEQTFGKDQTTRTWQTIEKVAR